MDFLSSFGAWCTPGAWHGTWTGAWHGGGMSGLLPFHLGPFLQIILVGMIAYVLLRRFSTPAAAPAKGQSPSDILKRRYALGELDQETFVRMMKDLG